MYEEADLIEMILMENEELETKFGQDFRANFKEVGKRKKCRNEK